LVVVWIFPRSAMRDKVGRGARLAFVLICCCTTGGLFPFAGSHSFVAAARSASYSR
jgi:hypothetical protein